MVAILFKGGEFNWVSEEYPPLKQALRSNFPSHLIDVIGYQTHFTKVDKP